jgi:two-component system nitrogen regulation response regulator NtrX
MKGSDPHYSSPQPGRLLIIDDDDVLLSALPWPIKRRMPHVNIDTADTPEEALRHVYSQDYDVILSDIRMPRMDGVTLLRKLRAIQPQTPVILCTACGEEELRRQANSAGAFAFVTKPLDLHFLVEIMKNAMFEHRQQTETGIGR